MSFWNRKQSNAWCIYVDAAVRAERGQCGLAVIVRDERGAVRQWFGARTGRLTNNEAEYAAAILALQQLRREAHRPWLLCSDSQILVHQMQGKAATHSRELQRQQLELRRLVTEYKSLRFAHIPREQNRLADALANEVVDGESPVGAFTNDR